MDEIKATIRENLLSLLEAVEGPLPSGENGTTRLAKLAKKKGSWGQRLLNDTDIGVSVVAEAAKMFGLQPWQLLVPKLDPAAKPTLSGDASAWPFPMVKSAGYWSLPPEDRAWVQSKIDSAIQERAEAIRRRAPHPTSAEGTSGPMTLALSARKHAPSAAPSSPAPHAAPRKSRAKRSASDPAPPQ